MARPKIHAYYFDPDGVPIRVMGGHAEKRRLWTVERRMEKADWWLWVKSNGSHPRLSECLKWLKDPHRIGEYFWQQKTHSRVQDNPYTIIFLFTHPNTAFEFKIRWG